MIWIIIGVIVALVLFYACANAFYEIACMKGHDERTYFWWTFFVPLLGALMVIALPDRQKESKKPQVTHSFYHDHQAKNENIVLGAHQWRCDNCGKMTDTNPCVHCGK